jgi:predicted transcriptional regulator
MLSYSESFRQAVEAFISENEVDPTTFGKQALGDPSFVFDLRKGRSPSAKTMDRVREWMASQRAAA